MTKHPHFDNDPVDSLECGDRLGYLVRIIGLNRALLILLEWGKLILQL